MIAEAYYKVRILKCSNPNFWYAKFVDARVIVDAERYETERKIILSGRDKLFSADDGETFPRDLELLKDDCSIPLKVYAGKGINRKGVDRI